MKKYLVYVSCSGDDLKAERLALCRVIFELGAVPVYMDGFDICREGGTDAAVAGKTIEASDYFVSLVAHSLGARSGHSFALEREHSLALKAGIPVLAFPISDKARWKDSKREKDTAAVKALAAFKEKLRGGNHADWMNGSDLAEKALSLLSREFFLNPRRGYVPGNEVPQKKQRRGAQRGLFSEHAQAAGKSTKETREFMLLALKVMAENRISMRFFYAGGETWENPEAFRYLKLWRLLAPELISPKSTADISHFLGNILNPAPERPVRKDFPIPSNTIKKLLADLSLLKVITCINLPEGEAWEMSGYGNELFAFFRLRAMHRVLAAKLKKLSSDAGGGTARGGAGGVSLLDKAAKEPPEGIT